MHCCANHCLVVSILKICAHNFRGVQICRRIISVSVAFLGRGIDIVIKDSDVVLLLISFVVLWYSLSSNLTPDVATQHSDTHAQKLLDIREHRDTDSHQSSAETHKEGMMGRQKHASFVQNTQPESPTCEGKINSTYCTVRR